jgi:hypothetical protein
MSTSAGKVLPKEQRRAKKWQRTKRKRKSLRWWEQQAWRMGAAAFMEGMRRARSAYAQS